MAQDFAETGLDLAFVHDNRYRLNAMYAPLAKVMQCQISSSGKREMQTVVMGACSEDAELHGYLICLALRPCSTKYAYSADGCEPLDYTALPEPLAQRAVRLCVLPLQEAPHLVATAAEVARSIQDLLPPGWML